MEPRNSEVCPSSRGPVPSTRSQVKSAGIVMSSHQSFAAPPGKRYAAFVLDAIATVLIFLIVAGIGEAVKVDLGRWDVLAIGYFAYQGSMLAFNSGQTFGRQMAEITVMSESGTPVVPSQAYFRGMVRALPLALIGSEYMVPFMGSFILLALIIAETRLIERTPSRQSVADRIAKTLVVNLPPPHTHRAPAGPMFSADDAEFGKAPKRPPRL